MARLLNRVGASAARHPWRVILAWIAATALALGLATAAGGQLTDNYTIPGRESQQAHDLLSERFPQMAGADARVVVHHADARVSSAVLRPALRSLAEMAHVGTVSPPVFSADGRTAMIGVLYDVPVTQFVGDEAVEALEAATRSLTAASYQVEFGGQVPERVQAPDGTAEMVGIGAALLILVLAFGSVLAAGLPIAVALVGLGIGTGVVTLLAAITEVSTAAPTLASMIGIGVGVDYALFVVTRFRDALSEGVSVTAAAAKANATAGLSVVFAGGTVLLALSGLQFTGVPNFRSFGFAPGVTVLVTVLAAVTLLPALLSLAGMRVLSRKSRRTTQLGASASHSPTATRLARTVARRPLAWTFASTALLLLIAVPALDMRVGTSDAGNEAKETTVRRAYDLVRDGFGPGFNGPFLVAVDLEKVDEASLPAIAEQVRTTEGIFSVAPAAVSADGSAAVISATPTSGPQEASTLALLDRLRSALPTGVHVGGFTATMDDFAQVMVDHLWLVVTIVLAASILLMILAFRSVVVPIKAVVVNLLSVASAYGVLVTVFQTETGAALVGLPGPVPIAPFVPVLMFAILFGLSMDYEVFLLSRVREEFLRSGDSKASVVEGLSSTARVISSAALIMVTVFLGFALDPGVVIKMMGVGLATAIALDATVVRLVLVPATMTLLGDRSWYMPRWLDRILPVVDTHGTPAYERTPPIEVALAGAPTNR